MKRALVLLGLCLLCTGCGKVQNESGYMENNYEGEEGAKEEMTKELTAEQEELLCAISVNKEKVKEGRLYDWQIEVVNQFDYAMAYLEEKYPSYSFKMVNCEPQNKMNSYTIFSFVEETNSEEYYDLYLYVSEDEPFVYEAKDNFYGDIKEEELADAFLKLMQVEYPKCVKVKSNIPYVQGKEFDEKLDVNQVLTGELKMSQDTTIYLQGKASDEVEYKAEVESIKAFLSQRGIAGNYKVVFVEVADGTTELYKENFFV